MPNIFHQSVEDVLKAATPEQRLLWNYVFLRWGERVPVSQYVYTGQLAGSELAIYSANKLYVAYSMLLSSNTDTLGASTQSSIVYNELNVEIHRLSNARPIWDATAAAARYVHNTIQVNNLLFARISSGTQVRFIGYRIAI